MSVSVSVCACACACACVCVCVCVCVCLSVIISSKLHVRSSLIFFVLVTYCLGSVFLLRRSDELRISVFPDDVVFAHKLRQLDIAAMLRQ